MARPWNQIGPDREARIVEMTLAGRSAAYIAEEVGTTKRSVVRVRSRLDVHPPPPPLPPWDSERWRHQLPQLNPLIEPDTITLAEWRATAGAAS